jgi:hypothetical protein
MDLKNLKLGIIPILLILLLFFLIGFYGLVHSLFSRKLETEPLLEVPAVALEKISYRSLIADFRLTRDRERSRLQEKLEEMLMTADQDQVGKIQDELLILMKRATLENEMENLLTAKGYAHNAVAIYPDTVTIIIKGAELNANLVSDLGDLVTKVTGYRTEQVRIME